ncbi:ThiF family adenylyltransferase [Paraburkholderia saeva]|uniref:ThiF family adenylyltransferase n=1 Tax=Paraburkholderia saeva TaxID=2777537 RepID=UPI001E6008D4|nr:ThiF family adenylyltransferase [Paraburkholderia saeva]
MLTSTTQDTLRMLDSIKLGTARFRLIEKTAVGWLTSLGADETPIVESHFPVELRSMWPEIRATMVPLADAGPILDGDTRKDARAIRAALLGESAPSDEQKDEILVLVTPSEIRAIYLWLEVGHNTAWEVAVVSISGTQSRQDREAAGLAEQRIAVVGCGSLGSKVASMLARAGVRNFVLIDDDVFLPENLVRHELNWESVGVHKVDALAHHLKLLGATDVTVRRQQLGGQESGGSLDGVMSLLSQSSLIVEASANDVAFTYVSKIAERTEKPVIWGKIFGGGFGGEIARVRPGIEPTAEVARYRISRWCDAHDVPPPSSVANRYESGETDAPMIAYDADVSAIAAQVARMVIDTAVGRTPSAFESSAYMIGLRKEWIFVAAFDTWPVDLGGPLGVTEQVPLSEDKARAVALDLLQIVGNPHDRS